MASDDLDIPQIAVVGVPDVSNSSSSSLAVPSPSLDSSARNSLAPSSSSSRSPSGNSSLLPPPSSPTLSAHSSGSVRLANSTILRDNNPEEHNGSSSLYLALPPHGHRRKGSIGTVSSIGSGSTTEHDADDNSSFRLSPLRSAHSDVTTLPSTTYTHVDSMSDVRSRSALLRFLKTLRVRRLSSSPSRETDTGSETTRNSVSRSHLPFSPAPLHSRIQPPPDKMHPTLSSWLKNINKLDSLINRLQELASSAPVDHRSQLFNKVAELRATFKKQQERCIEVLQPGEDYANKYLLDIDAEIRQQRTLLDNLEERLEAAKKLHGDAVDLRILYESGTVASLNDLRATGISRPLPEDDALFKEVDFVMVEIQRFYEELNKFWREEICCAVEALKRRRVDPRDFERWNGFRSSLKQTVEFWKKRPPTSDTQTAPGDNTSPSTGVDLGAIASSLSTISGSLAEALERISSSASLQYSPLSQSSFQRAYIAFAANSDLCLSFLRRCADYGEKMSAWCLSFNASPISSRVGVPYDLRERTARLLSETTGIPTENVASVKGSRPCKITYKKALALEQKTTSELNTLLKSLLSWVAVIDGASGDAPIDVDHGQELGELKCAWEKTRDCLRSALETLTSEAVHHHRSSLVTTYC